MNCRLHQKTDIDRILGYLAAVDPDPKVIDATRQLLEWYLLPKRSTALSSFSRLLEVDGIDGVVSANLISQAAADEILSRGDKLLAFDPDTLSPISDEELRLANKTVGAPLFITNLAWKTGTRDQDFSFCYAAIDRMVRWFEGNTIRSILFTTHRDYRWMVEPLLDAHREMVQRVDLTDDTTLFQVNRPWRPHGLSPNWASRLMFHYPKPSKELSDNLKPKGRLFYEFEFDVKAAMDGCIPSWSTTDNYTKWRQAASLDLNVNPTGSRRTDVTGLLASEFASNPRILTLY